MDGRFVPNLSIGIPVLKSLRKATEMFIDAHLMILEPVRYTEAFCKAGADLVNVHVEADSSERILAAIDTVKKLGKKAGVTLKPGTPAEAVLPYLDLVDLVLVMTVEPGFGGQTAGSTAARLRLSKKRGQTCSSREARSSNGRTGQRQYPRSETPEKGEYHRCLFFLQHLKT